MKHNKMKRLLGFLMVIVLCMTILPIYPLETQNAIAASRLSDVVYSSAGGAYVGPVTVELSSEVANANIYYTLDGSYPTKSSTLYEGPITISSSCTLQAFASAEGYYDSVVKSETYNILTTLEFKKTTLALEEFQSKDLKTMLSIGDGNCTGIAWSSSNPTIAVVDDNGTLTAKKQGGTVVTASSKNGTITQCTVTVKAPSISISSSKKLNIGSSVCLYSSTKKYADKITWKSSNTAIATVDSSGYVTAKKSGTCKISAICGSTTKTCKITVPAVKIKISASSLKLAYGKGKQLKASGNLSSSWIQWKSINPKVASVDSSGYVTTKAAGTCVISAYYGNKKANCKVTVPSFKLKGPKSFTLYSGEKRSITKGLTINGKIVTSASAKSANKKIVTISKGYLIGKKAGTTKVTISANGKKLVCTVKVPKTTIKTPKSVTVKYENSKRITPTIKTKRGSVYITKATSSNSNVAITYTGKKYITICGKKYNSSAKVKIYFSNGTSKTIPVKVPNIDVNEKMKDHPAYITTSNVNTGSNDNMYHNITIHNNSGKRICFVKYAVLEYDNKGDRLSENKKGYSKDYNDYVENASYVIFENSLSSNARKVRVCIQKIWYEDETTWTNPLYNSWYKKYKKKFD